MKVNLIQYIIVLLSKLEISQEDSCCQIVDRNEQVVWIELIQKQEEETVEFERKQGGVFGGNDGTSGNSTGSIEIHQLICI